MTASQTVVTTEKPHAPFGDVVNVIRCKAGDIVQEGAERAEIEPKEA